MWDFVSFNTFTLYCSSYTYLGKKQHKKIWKTIVWKKCVTLSAPNVEVANTCEWVSFSSSYLAIDFQWKKLQSRLAYMLLSLCEKMGWKWHWVGEKMLYWCPFIWFLGTLFLTSQRGRLCHVLYIHIAFHLSMLHYFSLKTIPFPLQISTLYPTG